MSQTLATRKTATPTIFAILIVAAFLLGGFAVTPAGAAGTTESNTIYATVDGLPFMGDANVPVGGEPSVVDISIRLPANTASPKVVVTGAKAATTDVTLSPARAVDTTKSDPVWWKARILLGTSDPGQVGQYVPVDGAKTNTMKIVYPSATSPTHTLAGDKAIVWAKSHTATLAKLSDTITTLPSSDLLTFFATTTNTGALGTGTISLHIQDKDITKPADADFTNNKASCPTGVTDYRFLLSDQDGNHHVVDASCLEAVKRGSEVAYLLRATSVDYSAASIAPNERFTLSLVDPSGDGGVPRLVSANAQLKQATDYGFTLFRDDYRTEVDKVSGSDTTYVLRVRDIDSNTNKGTADSLKVTARMLAGTNVIGSTNLVLTETGADTSEFQTSFKFARNPVSGQVAVPTNPSSSVSYSLVFVADDARGANAVKPSSQKVSTAYPWTPSSDSTIRILDQGGRLIASTIGSSGAALVKYGESLATFPQGTAGSDLQGSYIEVRVEDQDATSSTLNAVVRGARADPGTCNAVTTTTGGDTASCGFLTLKKSGSSSTYIGYVGLNVPTTYPGPIVDGEKTTHGDKARLLVSPDTIVTVEVLDERSGSGTENKVMKTDFIWKQSYDGQITVDKDNFYRSESVKVRILDPDQSGASSISALAKSTPTGSQLSLTLTPVAGQAGLFETTLKLSGSGSLATADADTVIIEYRDPQDANGRDRRASGQDPFTRDFQVWSSGSGFPIFTKKTHLDSEEGTIQVVDANHDAAASVPEVGLGATYSGIDDSAFLTSTDEANTYEVKIRPDEWLVTEPVTPEMRTGQNIPDDGARKGEESCYWLLPLSHVPSHFATVVAKKTDEEDVVWKHTTSASFVDKVFRYDAPRKRLIIDNEDQASGGLCNQASFQRPDVLGWTFHVTYVPAPVVSERVINAGSDVAELKVQLQAPYMLSQNGLSPNDLPKTDWTRSVPPHDADARGSWYIPTDVDTNIAGAPERPCTATVDGASAACDIDPATMEASVTISGGNIRAGAKVDVVYYQNNVGSTTLPSGSSSVTLPHGPVAIGSIQSADRTFRFDPAPGAQPNPVDALKLMGQSTTPTVQRTDLRDTSKATPTGDVTLFYHTQVFRDARVPYNERFADSEGRITASYADPSGAVGTAHTAEATASFSVNKPADITPKTPEGVRTNHVFGADQGAFLEVTDPAANADNTAIEQIKVNAQTRVVKFDGAGTAIEDDVLTLTETGPGTGVFTAPLRFILTKTANDGALSVAQNDMVQIDFDYKARESKTRAWYYRADGATMTLSSNTVLGEGATTSVELRDREVGQRVVDFRFTGMPDGSALTNKNLKMHLPPQFVPAEVDSEAVYVCKGTSDDCEIWKRISSNLAATDEAKQYVFNPNTGELQINLRTPTGSATSAWVPAGDTVRIDLRVRRTSDAEVRVATFDALGRFQPAASSGAPLLISETGASTGTFKEDVTFRRGSASTPYGLDASTSTITLLDGDSVELRAADTNFYRMSDRKVYNGANPTITGHGCNAATGTSGQPLTGCLMGVNHLVQALRTATWTETTNARLTVSSETFSAIDPSKDVYGAQPVTIRVVDGDQNVDPKKADTVQVTISSGGSTHTQTLTETGANSGVFEAVVVLRDVLSISQGSNYDVVYEDATSATGTSATRRLLTDTIPGTSVKVTSAKWFSAERGTISLSDDVLSKSTQVQIRVRDSDRNADPFQRDEIKAFSSGAPVKVYETSLEESLLPGGSLVTGNELVLQETGVDTGIFEGLLDVSTLSLGALDNETFLRFEYDDPKTHNGVEGNRAEVVRIVGDETGLPGVPTKTLTSRTQLVTVTVDDAGLDSDSRIEVFYKDFNKACTTSGSSANCKSLKLDGSGQVTFGIQQTDSDGILDVPVVNDKPFYVVYTDERAFDASKPGPRVLVQRLVLQSIDSALTTEVSVSPATPDGNDGCSSGTAGKTCFGWYKSSATVQLAVPEDKEQILQNFEYKFDEGGTVQSCAVGCSFTVSAEGENKVFVRSVTIGGFEEEWQNLTVKVDGTAPTATVSGLQSTLRPEGAVELTWTSTVDKGVPTEFGSYVIFRDSLDSDPVSTTPVTEETFTDDPGEEKQYTWYVVVADAAGNMDLTNVPDAAKVSATPDATAPKLDAATVSPTELHEEKGETTVTISATVSMDTLSDTDKVIVRAVDPFGRVSSEFELARQGTNAIWSGSFAQFNVSGIWKITVAAVDVAGNEGRITTDVRYFGIDDAPPIVEVPSSVKKGDPLKVTVKDNDAGVATVSYSVDGAAAVGVTVTGQPLNHTFDIPTAALSIGEHTLVVDVADAYSTPNEESYTFTFQVTGTDDGTTPPSTAKPTITQLSTLVEAGGALRFEVQGSGLTALTVAFDGGSAQSVLASWTPGSAVSASIGNLEAGQHTATITVTNAGGTTTADLTFYVLESGVPLPPESVVVTKSKDGKPKIDWTASPSPNVGGYLVHRASSPSVVIAVLGPDVTSYIDETAKDGKSYAYAVTAYGTNGEGRLAKGSSSDSLEWFGGVKASTFKVDVESPGLLSYWWIALILLAVIGAVALTYVYRERLFGRREDEEAYEAEYPDEAGSPFATEHHQMRCPNCTHEFSVSGQKPIITTCPNCGKKGILR